MNLRAESGLPSVTSGKSDTRKPKSRGRVQGQKTRDCAPPLRVESIWMDSFPSVVLCSLRRDFRTRQSFTKRLELPGYYRPEKRWDLLVVIDDVLVAVAEFKAQVGPSFGNNFNNRTEEAVGNATDLWAAYREGAFQPSQRPWLGYVFFLLEDCPKSTAAVTVQEPHFHVFPEFRDASYAKRYEILLTKLIRERVYDATCLIMSTAAAGLQGEYREPSEELGFARFAASFTALAISYAKAKERPKRPKQKPRDTD
jgi:Restriction endonuclease XhoI